MGKFTFVFANIAGAARGETCKPGELGRIIGEHLGAGKDTYGNLVAIGLSEVIVVEPEPLAASNLSHNPLPLGRFQAQNERPLDHLSDFAKGFLSTYQVPDRERHYLPHLNSENHSSGQAMEKKWLDNPRYAPHVNGAVVHQGTGAMLWRRPTVSSGFQLRPAGDPPDYLRDEPRDYLGDRHTEPRSALVFCGIALEDGLTVDLCFCQLETRKGPAEARVASQEALDRSVGSDNRLVQLHRLAGCLRESSPTMVLGDFNARPGSKELRWFEQSGFRRVRVSPDDPEANPSWTPARTEEDQCCAFSYLTQKLLVDHAFVRNLPEDWGCEARLLALPNEEEGQRVSDHRPIALTIFKRD